MSDVSLYLRRVVMGYEVLRLMMCYIGSEHE